MFLRLLYLLLVALACNTHSADDAKGPVPMQLIKRPIVLTSADCQAHGLPLIEIKFDLTGTSLMEHLFSGKDNFVSMGGPPGGPPGGPYHFHIALVRAIDGKLPALESLVRAQDLPKQNFSLNGAGTVEVNGVKHSALAYVIKPTPWADHCAAVLIPLSKSSDGILLTFTAAHDAKTGITPGESQQQVLKTLRITER